MITMERDVESAASAQVPAKQSGPSQLQVGRKCPGHIARLTAFILPCYRHMFAFSRRPDLRGGGRDFALCGS